MTAVVWTLVGVLTGTFGVLSAALFTAISRVDGLRLEMNGRFDGLHAELNGRFDSVHSDMRELRQAVAGLDHRLTATGG